MKSPFTGKEMKLIREKRQLIFRKEEFTYVHHAYQEDETGELFTTTKLDELNILQVYNQYRERFNLPFPEQIREIRKKYGVSAKKMAEILGFGVNSYRNYENGEVPSISNARLIQSAEDPKEFLRLLELCNILDEKEKIKFKKKAEVLIQMERDNEEMIHVESYFIGTSRTNKFTGYKKPDLKKFIQMIIFFTHKLQPFKTKMNKLLFYSDFEYYKRNCYSISGIRYQAIQKGPVPYKYQSIYEYLLDKGYINIENKLFPQGYSGARFIPINNLKFKKELFSQDELEVMSFVASVFGDKNATEISEISHTESGWNDNNLNRNLIDYNYAFELNQI